MWLHVLDKSLTSAKCFPTRKYHSIYSNTYSARVLNSMVCSSAKTLGGEYTYSYSPCGGASCGGDSDSSAVKHYLA